MKQGKWLTEDQFGIMKGVRSDLLKHEGFKIEKGAYGNLKEKIMIDIVGEHIDTAAKLSTLQVLIQMLGYNPQIMRDPQIKKILFKTLDLAGFNPHDFEVDEDTSLMSEVGQIAPRGGSVAAPVMNNLPTSMPQVAYSNK